MTRTTVALTLLAVVAAGGASYAIAPGLLGQMAPYAPGGETEPPQQRPPEGDDTLSIETLPASVPATVGTVTVLPPRHVRGGTPPFTRTLTGGPGASLAALGSIRVSTPSAGPSGPYTLTVTDSRGRTASTQMHVLASMPLAMRGTPPTAATVGTTYEARFPVTGGRPPYAWSFSGPGPTGTAFVNGVLSGTPTQPGTVTGMVVTASDADGRQAYSGEFSVDVADPLTVQALPATVAVTVGEAYRLPPPAVAGGSPPYAVSLSGPPGASLGTDGSVGLSPASRGRLGPYVVTVRDSRGRRAETRTAMLAMDLLRVSTYADSTLAAGIEGAVPGPGVSGGAPPYAFALVSDATAGQRSAPPGLALSAVDGSLGGLPTEPGRHGPYRIRVTDATGRSTASLPFTVTVADAAPGAAETPREVYVDGQRYCASRGRDDCARAGRFDTVEVRYAALQRVNELSFGCEFTAVPSGTWEISDGRTWTTVVPNYSGPCTASIPDVAVRAVRYTRTDGAFARLWAPRATLSR